MDRCPTPDSGRCLIGLNPVKLILGYGSRLSVVLLVVVAVGWVTVVPIRVPMLLLRTWLPCLALDIPERLMLSLCVKVWTVGEVRGIRVGSIDLGLVG